MIHTLRPRATHPPLRRGINTDREIKVVAVLEEEEEPEGEEEAAGAVPWAEGAVPKVSSPQHLSVLCSECDSCLAPYPI